MQVTDVEIQYAPIEQSHVFKCEVNGVPLMASVKGEYNSEDYFGYQIIFSDGFKGKFMAIDEAWCCDRPAKIYLHAVCNELNKFVALQLKRFINANLV
jgi:hypothetical protein